MAKIYRHGWQAQSYGSLAQLVEQRTFNPLVIGSNPIRPNLVLFSSQDKSLHSKQVWAGIHDAIRHSLGTKAKKFQ